MSSARTGPLIRFVVCLLALVVLAACAGNGEGRTSSSGEDLETVRVPGDAASIQEAVDLVAEGGLVLVGPGTYREQVLIETPNVTLRGEARNDTVIDGEGVRAYGVGAVADGVAIENLTVTDHTFYGALVTGLHDNGEPAARGDTGYTAFNPEAFPPVQRFLIDHVTAYNNGLYGLYAFNSQHGVIRDSYASGHADSGIYVGQCEECDTHVLDNVAENNALGFENANASDSVYVVGNRFSGNRIGASFLSNYREAFVPQSGNYVAGNLITDNNAEHSPSHAEGGFGIGLGISGGTDNTFVDNRVEDNATAGVMLSSEEDLAPLDNELVGTIFANNGVDLVNTAVSRSPAAGNCLTAAEGATSLDDITFAPEGLAESLQHCGDGKEQPETNLSNVAAEPAPPGVSFRQVDPPPAQPELADVSAGPRELPEEVEHVHSEPALPDPDHLDERAR